MTHLQPLLKCPTCFRACTLDGRLRFRQSSPPSLLYLILRYGHNHNCLDSHAVREADQSVWVEASLHSYRFSAVKVLLSLARSPWTRLVLLSEQISIAQRSKTMLNSKSIHTCARICVLRADPHAEYEHTDKDCNEGECQVAVVLQDASLCNLATADIKRIRWFLTFWQVEPKLCFGLEYGYLMSQSSWASLALANDSLINLTDSSLFLVSALQLFGVEIEHIILLSPESETEEQFALASLCKHKQTTAVFMQLLKSAWLTNEV